MSNKLVIFHTANPYREAASGAAINAGWEPEVFEGIRDAQDYLVDETNQADALFTPEWRPLLLEAIRREIPFALLSRHPLDKRHKLLADTAKDITIPVVPYEEIAPMLQDWLGRLTAEQSRT